MLCSINFDRFTRKLKYLLDVFLVDDKLQLYRSFRAYFLSCWISIRQSSNIFQGLEMSIESKMLPLLNQSLEEMETIHDILFTAKAAFANAIVERPSALNTKDIPRLYDGEKVLLAAIDRVLANSKGSAEKLSGQRDELMASVKSSERCRVSYLSALQKLAFKKRKPRSQPQYLCQPPVNVP